ncbi:hypothetical protein BDQ17DRAFT_1372830, partial [Cyathus striatus]
MSKVPETNGWLTPSLTPPPLHTYHDRRWIGLNSNAKVALSAKELETSSMRSGRAQSRHAPHKFYVEWADGKEVRAFDVAIQDIITSMLDVYGCPSEHSYTALTM